MTSNPRDTGEHDLGIADIVYPVRPGDINEELRFSLRSLAANYPEHGKVWVVGHVPPWLTGVGHIPGNASANPRENVYNNILAACRHPEVSDRFIVMNDDFFLTEPMATIPVAYRGTLADHLHLPRLRVNPQSWWRQSLLTTQVCLQAVGYPEPLSYELHVPFPVVKHRMRDTLAHFAHITPANPPQWRTLYGNLHVDDPVQMPDSKVFRNAPIRTPFHSTTDLSWRHFKAAFTAMFPEPSPYERQKVRA